MKLNEIKDNPGAHYKFKRVGRGIGSGKGKTCGRGVKGQKARTGVAINGFEGGQMPIYRRLPKRGFTNLNRQTYAPLNFDALQKAIDDGRILANTTITPELIEKAGLISYKSGVVGIALLARGELKQALKIVVAKASKTAREHLEKLGGTLELVSVQASNKFLPTRHGTRQ